jgi:hypothetical protein
MFARALANQSTAPDYVLITVVDARDGAARIVCTAAPFLEGALHMEFDIPYDEAGEHRVHDMAFQQPDRVFRFSKPKALANVRPNYTQRQLEVIHASIAETTDAQLLDKRFVQILYTSRTGSRGYRDAVAHALLERGISCRRGCEIGDLTPYR